MKKIITLLTTLILSIAVAFSVSACNVQTTVPGGDDGGGTVTPPPVENPDASVKLTVATLGKQDERTVMQEWINAFMKKNKDVSIEITKQMGGMPEIINWASAGELPDIVWTAGDQHSPYSGSGYFLDLSDETKFPGSKEFFSNFYDVVMDSTHYSEDDTKIWFVPRDYNRLVIYINETAFAEAGVALPEADWTWEDFLKTCNDLMAAGVKKAIEWKQWRPVYATMLANYGGRYLNENGEFALNSPETEKCYKFYEEIYKRSGFAISGEGAAFKSYSGNLGSAVPMIVDVRPQLPDYMATAHSGDWTLGVRAFPNFVQADGSEGFVGTGCSGYGISKACTDPAELEWAWKFLQFCMSEEGYDAVAYLGNVVPALKTLRNSGSWTEYQYGGATIDYTAFVADNTADVDLNYFNALPNNKHDQFIRMMDDFWKKCGSKSFAAAISETQKEFESMMKG